MRTDWTHYRYARMERCRWFRSEIWRTCGPLFPKVYLESCGD
jgi:hypothetical protein